MSCLDATFTLTPRSPWFNAAADRHGELYCFGADFMLADLDYTTLYNADLFFFNSYTAADPNIDYSQWPNRVKVPNIEVYLDLTGYGTAKQLALVFGFEITFSTSPGRVLVYSDAGLISDQTLAAGDNQILLEIDSLDKPFHLYFVHAGGYWFFRGVSGYVV
jgi:hypothetical protein